MKEATREQAREIAANAALCRHLEEITEYALDFAPELVSRGYPDNADVKTGRQSI